MVPPHVLHLHTKIGGQTRYIKENEDKCLTDDQASVLGHNHQCMISS